MKSTLLKDFVVDKDNNKITVVRDFNAPLDLVWAAWTKSEILDQWWAPKPWKARTKHFDFTQGGYWLYAMVGPAGEEHWARADYQSITAPSNYKATDAFCDENGNINHNHPRMTWNNDFTDSGDQTTVNITITFNQLEDLEEIIQMGFKEGFTLGLENLDEYLAVK